MPRVPLHALIWSSDQSLYELYTQNQLEQRFRPADEVAWLAWLHEVTSFAFQGASGSLNVYQEARPRGGQYWYAYHTYGGRTRKRYLGQTARVSFARLEETAKALSRESASPPLASSRTHREIKQPMTLLLTKLAPPCLPSSLVGRERLQVLLDGALSKPLTLLAASAGWGKTTLLATWANRHPQQVAWLSLDRLDTDPFHFWVAVIAALRTRVPGVGALALAMLHSPQPPSFSALLTTLLNELTEHVAPIVLLLDDYQVIEDPLIQETVTFWVEHLPAHVHLLLSSRVDPDLPLPRWRAHGQLLEIRTDDVRFRPDEVGLFLRQTMGLALLEEEVVTLERRTEGWVAALQLAALSLRQQEDPSAWIATFTGSHHYVLDYVQQEILGMQPEPIQRFLLQVAVLTRMNAALCQAVTGELASQEILETLERSHLFVVPLDSERQWYRLHDLFREVLHARLQASQPELVPLLHLRVARWYEMVGELREAIAYALAALDYSYAASLMEQAAPAFWFRGEARTVHTWMLALPDTVLRAHLRLALRAALLFVNSANLGNKTLYVSMTAQVERTFTRMEGILRSKTELALSEAEVMSIEQRLRLLRVSIETRGLLKRADTEHLRLVAQSLEALPADSEESWNMIPLFFTFWLSVLHQGEGASLISRLQIAKQRLIKEGDHLVTIRVMAWLALAYTQTAQLHRAQQECWEALALYDQVGGRTVMAGYLYTALFDVSYACNRLEEASEWLQHLRRIAQDWQHGELLGRGERCSARLALASGDLSSAKEALYRLEALLELEGYADQAPWVNTLRVHCWLAEAKLVEASEWAAQTTLSPDGWDPARRWEVLVLVRVSLAQQQYVRAVEILESFRRYFDRPGEIDTALEWMALSVLALHHSGKHKQAARIAARLLTLTESEGNMRVYLDLGTPMKQVLLTLLTPRHEQPEQAHRAPARSLPFVAQLVAAFEQEEQQRRTSPLTEPLPEPPQVLAGKNPSASLVPVEPLTRREQEILRLLSDGASNQEIADALVIQLSTVKKHVSNLLGKLGAESRTQAIAQAHTRSLL
jgi:LuxR family transcriptional regulator, maltose regulon positive regulatory protein